MKLKHFIILVLCLVLVFAITGCKDDGGQTIQTEPAGQAGNALPEIHTFLYTDSKFLSTVPDKKAPGTDVNCTAMQGMAASEEYIYTAKQKNDEYCNIFQFNTRTGEHRMLTYYASPEASQASPLDCVAHCNDMDVYDDADGTRYLMAATAKTPNTPVSRTCLVRFRLDEKNASIYATGFYNLVHYDKWGTREYVSAGSVRKVSETDSHHYFLVKDKNDFYWFKIPVNDPDSQRHMATELRCVKLFTIDNRNALFSNAVGDVFTARNLESWTNQGFLYHPGDDLLYVQLYNPSIGSGGNSENAIVTFLMDGMLEAEKLEQVQEDRDLIVFPTNLSFYLADPAGRFFEVESCVFLQNQEETGDLRLYFNTNGSDVKKFEGVWVNSFTSGSVDVQPLVTEDSIIYTITYDYNVPGTSKSQWKTNAENYHFTMDPTIHVAGIETRLRINTFVRDGYECNGWNLHRESDNAWLCTDGGWYPEDQIPQGVEKQLLKETQPVDNLTEVNGDVITAYIQWKKK